MKQIWNIFLQDLRNIKRVPLAGVLLLGLAILPSFYAWFNIKAAWDPYSNTKDIQVAVVNEDVGEELDGREVNIGDELVAQLQENDSLGWQFVSRDEAERGVREGDYYASIYIGKTFSKDLTSILKGDPQAAEIHYQVNEKLNAIAPKMTSAGATTIVEKISEQFIAEASGALFQAFNRIGVEIEKELPTIRQLEDRIFALEEHFPEIMEVANRVIEIEENWGIFEEKVAQFQQLEAHLPEVHAKANQILALEERLPKVNETLEYVLLLEEELSKIERMLIYMNEIESYFSEANMLLERAEEGMTASQHVIQTAQEMLEQMERESSATEQYVAAISAFTHAIEKSGELILDALGWDMISVQYVATSLQQTIAEIEYGNVTDETIQTLTVLDEQLLRVITMTEHAIRFFETLDTMSSAPIFSTILSQLEESKENAAQLERAVESALTTLEVGKKLSNDTVSTIKERATAVEEGAQRFSNFITQGGKEEVLFALQQLDQLNEKREQMLKEGEGLISDVTEILTNAAKMTEIGEERLQEIKEVFPQVEDRVKAFTGKVEDALPKVIALTRVASEFIENDFPEIEEKIHHVARFIREDLPGIEAEYVKLSELLDEKMPVAQQALTELATFVGNQLPEIEKQINDVADHIREIKETVDIEELVELFKNDVEKEQMFFKEPVILKEEQLFPIPNYGSANTPFYTVLCLWVGALLLSNILSTEVHPLDMKKEYQTYHIYLGRLLLFLTIGLLQGFFVSVGNLWLLGVYAKHPVLFVLCAMFVAFVFMTIVYTCTSVLGNIGKALAIILLVLQLSGAGGTFPIQVAPPFFQTINPFLPFTYAINLLRETVGGIIPLFAWKQVGMLTIFWSIAIGLGLLLKKPLYPRVNKTKEKSKSSRLME